MVDFNTTVNAKVTPEGFKVVNNDESDEDMVDVKVTKEKEYTEHTGVAEFTDGETREVTFDAMKEKDGAIVLKNYTGYSKTKAGLTVSIGPGSSKGGFTSEAFMTIPYSNLKTFETTDRETKTMEYEVEKQVPESEVEDK